MIAKAAVLTVAVPMATLWWAGIGIKIVAGSVRAVANGQYGDNRIYSESER